MSLCDYRTDFIPPDRRWLHLCKLQALQRRKTSRVCTRPRSKKGGHVLQLSVDDLQTLQGMMGYAVHQTKNSLQKRDMQAPIKQLFPPAWCLQITSDIENAPETCPQQLVCAIVAFCSKLVAEDRDPDRLDHREGCGYHTVCWET